MKQEEKPAPNPNQVRINVQNALKDSLIARAKDADDIDMNNAEIRELAVVIESDLFTTFNDTGHKYRTKYRSLIFNIKDQKNKGLFRKILTGKIKPDKLVQVRKNDSCISLTFSQWVFWLDYLLFVSSEE